MNQKVLEAKESIVNEVAEKVTNSGSVTVVEYHGLSVAEITNLRRDLRNVDADCIDSLLHCLQTNFNFCEVLYVQELF